MATANSLFKEEATAMDTTSDPLYTHGSEQQNESTTFRDRKKMTERKRKYRETKRQTETEEELLK